MKYPRTPHLPGSYATKDDQVLKKLNHLRDGRFIVTEKMDGAGVILNREGIWTRNGKFPSHPSYDKLKNAFYRDILYKLPVGVDVYAEWCEMAHGILYDKMPPQAKYRLFIFNARDSKKGVWFPWEDVRKISSNTGIPIAPMMDVRHFSSTFNVELYNRYYFPVLENDYKHMMSRQIEGVVLRLEDAFVDELFPLSVMKYVYPFERGKYLQGNNYISQGGK